MQSYPLIYRFSAVIVSERFRAHLRGTGHALAVFEDERWWCSGVEPGGLIEPGAGPVSAYLGFRKTLGQILEQLAEDSASIEDFAGRAARFFGEADAEDRRRWLEAVEALRGREPRLTEDVACLPRAEASTRPGVEVEGANVFHEQTEALSLADPAPRTKAA